MQTWATSAACRSAWAWFAIALPALVLNYFRAGRSAHHRSHGSRQLLSINSRRTGPITPLVSLATVATVIASQAIISGVFSLTQQAVQLGFLPRMHIRHTASHEIGQIYVPLANWLLAVATLGAVIGFGTSGRARRRVLGIAVSLLYAITTLLAAPRRNPVGLFADHRDRGERLLFSSSIASSFAANSTKFPPEGGWFPLLLAARSPS